MYNIFVFLYYKKLKLLYNKPYFKIYINSYYSYKYLNKYYLFAYFSI